MNAKIISEGGSAFGTRVLTEGGAEIPGIRKVTFTAEVDDICRIDAEIMLASIEAEGKLTLFADNPETGQLGEVRRIEFADGTEWIAA